MRVGVCGGPPHYLSLWALPMVLPCLLSTVPERPRSARWSHSSPRQEPAGPRAFGTQDLAFFKPGGREGLLRGPHWRLLAGWVVSSMCVNAGRGPVGRWEWSLNSVLVP